MCSMRKISIVLPPNSPLPARILSWLTWIFSIKWLYYDDLQNKFGERYPQYGDKFFEQWNLSTQQAADLYSCEIFNGDEFLADYFRKLVAPRFLQFNLARNLIDSLKVGGGNIYQLYPPCGPVFNKVRFEKIGLARLSIYIPLIVSVLVHDFIRYAWLSWRHRSQRVDLPDILYLRKKVAPDMLLLDDAERYFLQRKLNFSASFALFSDEAKTYGIYSLSAYTGSMCRVTEHFFKMLISLLSKKYIKTALSVPVRDMVSFCRDDYLARIITGIGSKVLFGVLADKPRFILLSKYKHQKQSIVTMTDGFTFRPMPSANFVNADYYLASNSVEGLAVNVYGGNIKKIIDVGFFRGTVAKTSEGLSDQLKKWVNGYAQRVVVLPSQVSRFGYGAYSPDNLSKFLEMILRLAKVRPEVGFIIKEKKGELRVVDDEIHAELKLQNNIYVIRCDDPKLLKFDDYISILSIATLALSFAIHSTVIFQAIYSRVPVLIYDGGFKVTVWSKYKGIQFGLGDLQLCLDSVIQDQDRYSPVYDEMSMDLSVFKDGFNNVLAAVADVSHNLG